MTLQALLWGCIRLVSRFDFNHASFTLILDSFVFWKFLNLFFQTAWWEAFSDLEDCDGDEDDYNKKAEGIIKFKNLCILTRYFYENTFYQVTVLYHIFYSISTLQNHIFYLVFYVYIRLFKEVKSWILSDEDQEVSIQHCTRRIHRAAHHLEVEEKQKKDDIWQRKHDYELLAGLVVYPFIWNI